MSNKMNCLPLFKALLFPVQTGSLIMNITKTIKLQKNLLWFGAKSCVGYSEGSSIYKL